MKPSTKRLILGFRSIKASTQRLGNKFGDYKHRRETQADYVRYMRQLHGRNYSKGLMS